MLTLADMGGRGGQGKNDRMTQHGGGREAESKVTIFFTPNVLLGMPQVTQRVSKVTTGVLKGQWGS